MSDSGEVGQRLVDAASDAFDVGIFNFDAVVIAVLRELAANPPEIKCWLPIHLQALADSIEKGITDAATG